MNDKNLQLQVSALWLVGVCPGDQNWTVIGRIPDYSPVNWYDSIRVSRIEIL